MIKLFTTSLALAISICCGCWKEPAIYQKGDIKIIVEKGEEWLHNFPLFMGIKIQNAPQIAIWAEDMEGNYLTMIYVTSRIANQSWRQAGENRRKEALPHWCYSRGVQYEDGLYMPTKKEPLTDGASGATPRGDFTTSMQADPSIKNTGLRSRSTIPPISMNSIHRRLRKELLSIPAENMVVDNRHLFIMSTSTWIKTINK